MEADVARLQRRVQELEAENAEFKRENQRLRTENGALKEVVQRLDARIRALEHRLHRNSSNSSRPPSSDPPNAPPPAPPEPPSGRKPGGQPGHPPANRKPFPPDEVNHFVPVYPKTCHGCHRKTHASSLKNMLVWLQPQVVDLPPVSAEVTEYDCYAGACEHCGAWNVAEVPRDVRGLIAGPRLQAVASLEVVLKPVRF